MQIQKNMWVYDISYRRNSLKNSTSYIKPHNFITESISFNFRWMVMQWKWLSVLLTMIKSIIVTFQSYDPLLSASFAPAFYARMLCTNCGKPVQIWLICQTDWWLLTFRKPHSGSWCVSCSLQVPLVFDY